jgi:hypothetical protein
MNVVKRTVVLAVAGAFLAAGLCACDGRTPGQDLDKALVKTGDTVIEVGEAIKPK